MQFSSVENPFLDFPKQINQPCIWRRAVNNSKIIDLKIFLPEDKLINTKKHKDKRNLSSKTESKRENVPYLIHVASSWCYIWLYFQSKGSKVQCGSIVVRENRCLFTGIFSINVDPSINYRVVLRKAPSFLVLRNIY